ncbi:ThuA domain-containing protein [Muriicola sp. Z0-33]|uniref:ThuA domain-containing protein n=1 Tax=Muriicola sp. Z0-33 TaxID=2816957 RepID=UPI0022376B8E|nr:ThuA domain-containing protein [Muriicola sp. Z0-33]MCW5515790.1 ThuA domain-containing protein [Muriicola sp. Z0-33]
MRYTLFISLFLFVTIGITAQDLAPFEVTQEWKDKIAQLAPSEPGIKGVKKKKLLVFSKATGFYHWVIPHNVAMLKILAQKSNAFEIHIGYDIGNFEKKRLKEFDAIILNNPNPRSPDRNLFQDLLQDNTSLNKQQIAIAATKYEKNLMDYVSKGGGLMILHGGIVVQNNSLAFSKMTGGSFDYHPQQQQMNLKEVDARHRLVQAFDGKGFTHIDEPYIFKNAYFDYNFRPLLYVETDKIMGLRKALDYKRNYVSWIKRYGKGRVFYTATSHNAQSLENASLLQFILDGMQYVVGDLKCDDSPMPGIGAKR